MYKVLIVDDEPFILDGMTHIINWEDHGAEIAAKASNGAEALEILDKMNIHIVITDILMPTMDGLELIRNIRKEEKNIKIIILSGYDDFKYVKEASKLGIENYLLKSIEEEELSMTLLNTIEKLDNELNMKIQARQDNNILKENILFRWVTNNINDEELLNRAGFLNICLSMDYYLVCLARTIKKSESTESIINNPYLMSFAVQNICSEILGSSDKNIVFNSINGDTVILLSWNECDLDRPKPVDLMKSCSMNIYKYLKTEVLVTIGSIESGYKNAHISYSNAFKLLDYQFVLPSNTVIDFETIHNSTYKVKYPLQPDYEILKKYISSKNLPLSIEFVDDLYLKLSRMDGITPEYVRSLILEILFNVFGTLSTINHPNAYKNEHSGETDLYEILNTYSLPDIFAWVKSLIESRIRQSEEIYEKIDPVVKTILQYIDKHYNQGMSLKTLSAAYNVNAAYLGQLFKNATGEMFSAYLNKVRIEKAKEMLSNTSAKSNEIALKVGYSNVNYFSNLFKKITGIYPMEYKKSLNKPIT